MYETAKQDFLIKQAEGIKMGEEARKTAEYMEGLVGKLERIKAVLEREE